MIKLWPSRGNKWGGEIKINTKIKYESFLMASKLRGSITTRGIRTCKERKEGVRPSVSRMRGSSGAALRRKEYWGGEGYGRKKSGNRSETTTGGKNEKQHALKEGNSVCVTRAQNGGAGQHKTQQGSSGNTKKHH